MGTVGYRLNRFDKRFFMAGQKPMLTEFGILQRLESCAMSIIPSIDCTIFLFSLLTTREFARIAKNSGKASMVAPTLYWPE